MAKNFYTDIIVVGGGAAGVAAAVAAAKAGMQVALFERNSYLGGKATAAEVGTVCGLYHFSKKGPQYIVTGFAKEFAERIRTGSQTSPISSPNGLHYLPYNIQVFKATCCNFLLQYGASVYYNALVTNVSICCNQITAVEVTIDGEACLFYTSAVVDCSGEGAISKLAHLPLVKSERYQAAAQVFTVKNLTAESLTEASLGLLLMKELTNAIQQNILESHFDRLYLVPGTLQDNQITLKVGVPLAVTNTCDNQQELRKVALQVIDKLLHYLTSNVPVFKDAQLESIAPEVGTRIGQRGKGKYVLTEKDVLTCRKFSDAIANAAWPIEEWEQNRRVRMQYFAHDDFYQIPAGCLQSETIGNLFFAGRHISATDSAIASARVIGICLQTGYAAGKLAAALMKGQLHINAAVEKEYQIGNSPNY